MSDKKISYIGFMQIIGPIFVVLGHSLNGFESRGVWYVFSKEWIYLFHMPLFFLVSGYLLSFKGYLGKRSYSQFVFAKFKRLLIPYLVWNLLFWIPKFFAQNYISDSAPLNMAEVLKAFLFPRQNVWGHTWFLMGLFTVYLSAPLFQKIFQAKRLWISIGAIIVCIVLYILPIDTEFFALSDLHKDLLFFVIGCLLGQIETDTFAKRMKDYRIFFFIGAIVFSTLSLVWFEQTKPLHFIPCAFILLAFLSVFVSIKNLPVFLEKLSSYSFSIYITHWPVMITVRIVLYQILNCGVLLTAVSMSVLGYIIPILVIIMIRKLPLKRFKEPLKYLLGV